MPLATPKPSAAPWLQRMRCLVSKALRRAADACDPQADLAGQAHVEARVFTPRALGEPLREVRYLMLGLCQVGDLAEGPPAGVRVDYVLYDGQPGSALPAFDPAHYDAVVLAPSLRVILNEGYGEAHDLLHARSEWTPARAEAAFELSAQSLAALLERLQGAVSALPVFVLSLLEPSFSYLGLLQPPSDPTHPTTFVRRLNARLVELSAAYPNLHVFDLNGAFNMIGRLHLQDDGVTGFTHAGTIGTFDDELGAGRLIAGVSNHHVYDVAHALPLLRSYIFRSLGDALKIIGGEGRIKLIVVDLDDTLWRGVAADSALEPWARTEGWPIGFVEALLYFKRRGGLLAICSKNEREPTLQLFAEIWRDGLVLDDFVSVKINWTSKAQNIAAILQETNISAAQALFVDDNPREVDEVRAAFPDLRCLNADHRDWRRIILRAPETQVTVMSEESERRTELVRARIDRDFAPAPLDRAAWLRSLRIEQRLWLVSDIRGERFERALELLNKTNQFNTTGRRWSLAEMTAFLAAGGRLVGSSLKDRTVDNGLIAVAAVEGSRIVQVVLSCRVFGLGAETTLGAVAIALAFSQAGSAEAEWIDTGRNLTCRDYYQTLGFTRVEGRLVATQAPELPDWISTSLDPPLKAAVERVRAVHA